MPPKMETKKTEAKAPKTSQPVPHSNTPVADTNATVQLTAGGGGSRLQPADKDEAAAVMSHYAHDVANAPTVYNNNSSSSSSSNRPGSGPQPTNKVEANPMDFYAEVAEKPQTVSSNNNGGNAQAGPTLMTAEDIANSQLVQKAYDSGDFVGPPGSPRTMAATRLIYTKAEVDGVLGGARTIEDDFLVTTSGEAGNKLSNKKDEKLQGAINALSEDQNFKELGFRNISLAKRSNNLQSKYRPCAVKHLHLHGDPLTSVVELWGQGNKSPHKHPITEGANTKAGTPMASCKNCLKWNLERKNNTKNTTEQNNNTKNTTEQNNNTKMIWRKKG